jgi:hypothetical protein
MRRNQPSRLAAPRNRHHCDDGRGPAQRDRDGDDAGQEQHSPCRNAQGGRGHQDGEACSSSVVTVAENGSETKGLHYEVTLAAPNL